MCVRVIETAPDQQGGWAGVCKNKRQLPPSLPPPVPLSAPASGGSLPLVGGVAGGPCLTWRGEPQVRMLA